MQSSAGHEHVALFGYYNKRNFGDDLMAVIFGLHLRRLGVTFKVFGLPRELLAAYGFCGTSDIDELLHGAVMVIHGGGGLLLTADQNRSKTNQYEKEIEALRAGCLARKIPIHLISVGGDGDERKPLAPARRQYLEQAAYVSLRNPEDVHLVGGGIPHDVFDDVVWSGPQFFPHLKERARTNPLRIAIDRDLFRGRGMKLLLWIVVTLSRIFRRKREYLVLDGSYDPAAVKEASEHIAGLPVRRYATVEQFVGELARTDVLLTRRLHMGMTVLAFGGRVIQLFPRPKAMLVFDRLGLGDWQFLTLRSCWRLPLMVLGVDQDRTSTLFHQRLDLEAREASARRHLEKVASILRGPASHKP